MVGLELLQIYSYYFTGSKPAALLRGLHLNILLIDSDMPFIIPNLAIASRAYSEQLGVNLQPPEKNIFNVGPAIVL